MAGGTCSSMEQTGSLNVSCILAPRKRSVSVFLYSCRDSSPTEETFKMCRRRVQSLFCGRVRVGVTQEDAGIEREMQAGEEEASPRTYEHTCGRTTRVVSCSLAADVKTRTLFSQVCLKESRGTAATTSLTWSQRPRPITSRPVVL